MELFGKDLAEEVVVVAEIGVNHEGDVDAASEMIALAAEAGADAVKFQSYTPSRFISSDDRERLERVSRFALDKAAHERLAAEAKSHRIAFFSSAITEDWVEYLAQLCPAIKIASGDLTFEPVIRNAAATGLPLIVSTGLGTLDEIDRAVGWVESETFGELAERLVLLHCVSAYPTPIEEANVRAVPFLRERYGVPVGYSNHTLGIAATVAAVALGAPVVEVHFTNRREGRTFHDHALSLEPAELAELVRLLPRVRASLGTLTKGPVAAELPNVDAIRKGVVARHDLRAGAVLSEADLAFARPATQYPASELPALIGRTLVADVAAGGVIQRAAVAPAGETSN